jgi:hypothetical protein
VALVFDVFQRFQAEEQKVAAAAGRVEHTVVLELVEPLDERGLRELVVLVAFLAAFGQQPTYFLRDMLPYL